MKRQHKPKYAITSSNEMSRYANTNTQFVNKRCAYMAVARRLFINLHQPCQHTIAMHTNDTIHWEIINNHLVPSAYRDFKERQNLKCFLEHHFFNIPSWPELCTFNYASVRACAQRHTVVCLCVCVSVCLCITAITAQRLKCKCK